MKIQTSNLNIRIEADLLEKVKLAAKKEKRPVSAWVRGWLIAGVVNGRPQQRRSA